MKGTGPWRHVWESDYPLPTTRYDERVTNKRVDTTRRYLKNSGWIVIVDVEHLLVLDLGGKIHIFIHESLEGGR